MNKAEKAYLEYFPDATIMEQANLGSSLALSLAVRCAFQAGYQKGAEEATLQELADLGQEMEMVPSTWAEDLANLR